MQNSCKLHCHDSIAAVADYGSNCKMNAYMYMYMYIVHTVHSQHEYIHVILTGNIHVHVHHMYMKTHCRGGARQASNPWAEAVHDVHACTSEYLHYLYTYMYMCMWVKRCTHKPEGVLHRPGCRLKPA